MRRSGVVVLAALLAFLGMLAPPAQAQAPTPKVSLGGTFEVITSAHWNLSQVDNDYSRARDTIWSTRQRTVLVALGEVDKARGVLALEMDLGWGMTGTGSGAGSLTAGPQLAFSTGTAFGASNDVMNVIEIKQMYVQFPVPLIPWSTITRLGGQPGAGTVQYKPVVYFDDFAGVYLTTTFTPAVKTHFIYGVHDEDAFGCTKPTQGARDAGGCAGPVFAFSSATGTGAAAGRGSFQRGDDHVLGGSLDMTPVPGLDIRPFILYWIQKGVFNNSQNTPLPTSGFGGVGAAGGGVPYGSDGAKRELGYIGLDARWKAGPFYFDPTFIYLHGTNTLACTGLAVRAGDCQGAAGLEELTTQDVRAWMVDLRGGWRIGPLLLEAYGLYVPGNDARDNLGNTAGSIHDVNYFTPINTGGGYGAGWSNFFTSNDVDYIRARSIGTSVSRGSVITYDRYGAMAVAFRPSYALTNRLTFKALVAGNWTAEDVDTRGTFGAAGITPETQGRTRGGDDNYLGTEFALGLTWAFAPGLTFDAGAAHLFAGEALEQCKGALAGGACLTGSRDARDASSVAARVRFSF